MLFHKKPTECMKDQKTIPAVRMDLPTRNENSSKELCEALLTPEESMRLFRKHLTPLACANSGAYSLSALRRIHNEDSVIMMLVAWISNLQRFLNVSAKMDAAQMYETCRMILDDFWALNSADVNLVMSRAKRGFYGQLFGRIDGQIIYQWFAEYFEERCEACANREVHVAGLHGSVINRLSDETKAKILELWESQRRDKSKDAPVCDS